MRPKDHADIIFDRFLLATKGNNRFCDYPIAKQCSIIHAQAMYDQAKAWGVDSVLGYWKDVIKKIKELDEYKI